MTEIVKGIFLGNVQDAQNMWALTKKVWIRSIMV